MDIAFAAARQPRNRIERAFLLGFVGMQLVHVAVVFFLSHPAVASNFVQSASVALAMLLCVYYAIAAEEKQQRWRWIQLSTAFLTWQVAEAVYLANMLTRIPRPTVPLSDEIWIFFALPLLLIASSPSHGMRHDLVSWLDTGQSCLFFLLVFALIYPGSNIISVTTAYNIQSFSLLLAFSIRYSIAELTVDQVFYRNLAIFSVLYATCNAIGYSDLGRTLAGPAVDLFWTVPFTGFGYMMICASGGPQSRINWRTRILAPRHLHGISALGLAIMCLVSSAVLARHHPAAGILGLTVSFLLFAARTSMREWQLGAAHTELEYSALHDPLTGLPNRRMLHQELSSSLARPAVSAVKHVALLFIDLDRFKTINDALGHSFGDRLLFLVAERLCTAARSDDIVGRQGGDEFVVLLKEVDAIEAEVVAQRVIDRLREPLVLNGRTVQVTASIGIVLSLPESTADGMLQDADCAMYKAKGLGKDRAETFAPNMLTTAKWKLELETGLRKTLAEDGIEVQYQPIYELPDRKILGFEALARWRDPIRGPVSPAEFIPIAEDTGLIVDLGRQVLEKACRQCRAWNDRFGISLSVGVNVSAHQFANPGFLDDVVRILRESRLDAALLKLEITESTLISNYDAVEQVLTRARVLGIVICLDDFGTGYSSLSHLLRFPFDVVKIDRSFVSGLDGDHRRSAMVRLIIDLADTLQKRIIAEGVETEAELTQLVELGCVGVQGFLLSVPLSPSAVETLLLDAERGKSKPALQTTSPLPWPVVDQRPASITTLLTGLDGPRRTREIVLPAR